METTKITASDVERFITKAVENNINITIVKDDNVYQLFANDWYITFNRTSVLLKIYGKYIPNLIFNITDKEFYSLAQLLEDTIPYCEQKAVECFKHYFDPIDSKNKQIEDFD